jgi:hypothetical protein
MQPLGQYEFSTAHEWTAEALIGLVFSTSFLSRDALGDHTDRFADDLRRELRSSQPDRTFSQAIDFGYELARRAG